MAKADSGINTDRMALGAAKSLLLEAYGTPQLAEDVIREKCAADPDRKSWGYLRKRGNAPDHELWRCDARVNYEESSAHHPAYTMFFLGSRDVAPLSTEWLGIWVSRALLPEAKPAKGGSQIIRVKAALKKLYPPDGKVPDDVTTGAVFSDIGKHLKGDSGVRGKGIPSWDTVNRALGRAKR